MNPIFLDTSGLIAVVNVDDTWHAPVMALWADLIARQVPLVTTSLVLIEIGDGLSRVGERQFAIQLYQRLQRFAGVEIMDVTTDLENRGWKLFQDRPDKDWGMTDCISFVAMSDRAIRDAFTLDHHFEQAGFVRLLK